MLKRPGILEMIVPVRSCVLPYVDGDMKVQKKPGDEDGIKYIRCYHNDKELSELCADRRHHKAKQG